MNEILSGDLECDYKRGEPLHCHALYYNLYTRGPRYRLHVHAQPIPTYPQMMPDVGMVTYPECL